MVAGLATPAQTINDSLAVIEPITLTALFASLLVPFAGFASNERWQKFALQYAIIPLFGVYSISLWQQSSIVGLMLLGCATSVHLGYWMSSIHSRNYRLDQFRLGFAQNMPCTTRIIAELNGQGKSERADSIIRAVLGIKTTTDLVHEALSDNHEAVKQVRREMLHR